MAYTSEIEKLEKRWAENPKGRNFAPLADAYRKAGELDRAIELCKSGLERHPDYVSAHIVYGRCLVDQRQDVAAGEVFQKVLTLDPENILALRVLAEICERGKRFEDAVGWLTKLLAVDPMNGEAAEHLARAKGKAAAAAKPTEPFVAAVAPAPAAAAARAAPTPRPAPAAPKVAAPSPRAAPPPAPPKPDFVVEHGSLAQAEPPPLAAPKPSSDIETFDGALGFNAVAHDAAKAEGLEVQEDIVLEPQKLDVEGLARTQYESGTFAMPEPPPGLLDEDLPQVDLPLIMPDDVMPAATPRAAAPPPPPPSPPPAPPPPTPPPPKATPAPAAVALSDDDGAADQAALSRAEPVLTETMAELYIKQGHTEDGLRVYQALLAQRPGDVRLRTKVDQLMRKGPAPARSGQSAQAFLRSILARRPVRAEASSLEQAFAAATPEPELPAPGEATRPASDTISLDAIFGDEGGRGGGAASLPETPPPAGSAAPRPGGGDPGGAAGSATGGFSFDQFFSGGAEAAPGAAGGEPPAKAAGRPSGGKGRPPVEDEAALDQFQAWLKGLKS